MNEQDVRLLLAAAMSYDNRKPGEANVKAWMEAANRARWTFQSALDAIHEHYAFSSEFLMPAHITARVRAKREDEALRAAAALPAPEDPQAAERHRQIVRSIVGQPSDEAARTAEALSVTCPWCGAVKGDPCSNGKRRRRTPHPSRIEAARKAA